MRLKMFFAVLILLLTLTPISTVPTMRLGELLKSDNSIKNVLTTNNNSAATANGTNGLRLKNWDFENVSEWSKYVCISDDSIELVLGLDNPNRNTMGKLETAIEEFHGKIINHIWMRGVLHSVVVNLSLQFASSFVKEIQDFGIAKYVEPNAKYQIDSVPNDPYWELQWGPQTIGADKAWNTTIGKRDILVAVVDTGIDWNHTDLAANYVSLGYDWVNNDTSPMDDNGHGTHCAGIIAATFNNSIGIAGIAQVRIMAEKGIAASGSGNEDDLAKAIIHAVEQNATIISMSWGSNVNNTLIYEAIKFAYDSGVLLVASAGNARSDYKSYPAAYDEVIAVAATDQQDRPAFFTNFGDWIELAAPGVSIYSTILNNQYGYKSGTSMACPHVTGVAALVWSNFPNMTRDQVRYHLRYTADDLGSQGFDETYGYGRINATRAVNQPLPENDLLIESLKHPSYVELNSTGILNATILNYGARDENNITVEFLSNSTIVSSHTIEFLKSGLTTYVNFTWTPLAEGFYNVTINMLPVPNETIKTNNLAEANIYGGTPTKAYVIRSSGTYYSWSTATWEKLNKNWFEYGNKSIFIDFTTLDKGNIPYEDLTTSGADVLIIASAYSEDLGWEFTDSEIEAITKYVYEGHGLVVTANTFWPDVPNNNKFTRILGIDETVDWSMNVTSSMNILKPEHPIFRNISTPYGMSPAKLTTTPDGRWTDNALVGAEYVALGRFNETAIVTYRGLVYSSATIESYASQSDLQLFYNIITWSHYERPEHDLIAGLETPQFALPCSSAQLNATVSNVGTSNETNVELLVTIDGSVVANVTIPELTSDLTYATNYLWTDLQRGTHNVTAYAPPVTNETNPLNNKITKFVTVSDPIIQPTEGQWANYTLHTLAINVSLTELVNFTYNHYISPYEINVTCQHSSSGQEWTTSSIVNTITRQVERGTWENSWFPGWIETNITFGSQLKVLSGTGTVVGTRNMTANNRTLECWNVFVNFPYENYTFYYEKYSGLLTGYDRVTIAFREDLTLQSTNIPVGRLIQPRIGDYALYEISHFDDNNVTAFGWMRLYYAEFVDVRQVRIQVDYMLLDTNGQPIENFTGPILVNTQTRLIEEGPTGWNGTYYFSQIETDVNLGSSVRIWNQTGTVVGNSIYPVGQRVFDTWLVYMANETQICFYNYDMASGLMIKSTETSLNNPSQNVTFMLLQTNIDVTPPMISIQKPANNTFINSAEIEVEWAGSDNETGISHYMIYLNDSEVAYIGSAFSTYVLTEITDGTYTIKVEAYDSAGNVNSAEVTTVVDATPPTAHIVAPSNGSYLKGVVSIDVGGNDTWFDFMQLSINDVCGAVFFSEGNQTYYWDTREYNDGAYSILLKVVDKAGNAAIDQIAVIVDNTGPEVQILQSGEYVKGHSNVVVYAYDANLDNVSLYVNDQLIDTWSAVGAHTTLWNTTAFLDGINTLKVTAFDKARNSAEQFVQVTVDNTPPETEIVLPTNGTYVSGNVHINLTVTDDNLESATLTLDGETLADVINLTSFEWNTTQVADGLHILKIEAIDKAGNRQIDTSVVAVDNTKPVISILSPKDNTPVSGNITITFTIGDRNLQTAVVFVNQTAFDVTNATELTVDTKALQEGTYELRLTALDYAGNQNEAAITIVVDNLSPTATINAPANGTQLLGTVTINFAVSDEHLANVFLNIDNETFNVAGQTSFQWNTTNVGDGAHVIRILAADTAGNAGENQITVWTTNVERATEDSYNAGRNLGILAGVLSSMVAAIAVIIIIKYLPQLNLKIQKPKKPQNLETGFAVKSFHKVFMNHCTYTELGERGIP